MILENKRYPGKECSTQGLTSYSLKLPQKSVISSEDKMEEAVKYKR